MLSHFIKIIITIKSNTFKRIHKSKRISFILPTILDYEWSKKNENVKKGGQVVTVLLFISCQTCCNGYAIFEFNDKLLYLKNDSERRRCVLA